MFFGEDGGIQRYDDFRYPQFDKLNQTMLGYFWRPEEVSLQKDRADFMNFRPEQKHIFNIKLEIPNTARQCAGQRTESDVLTIRFQSRTGRLHSDMGLL